MIVYGTSVTTPGTYALAARRGLDRVVAPDDVVLAHAAVGPIARTYNLMLEEASALEDVEAVVLVHQDAELTDPGSAATIRAALADPQVALAGPVGSSGAGSIAWWEGEVSWASVTYAYGELGGGELAAPSYAPRDRVVERRTGPVEQLYGVVLVLSPWAARTLRFDEGLDQRLGYDYDLSRQVRAAGREVVSLDLPVVHHHSLDLVHDPETWAEAHRAVQAKWEAGEAQDWQARARAAEADAGGARMLSASQMLRYDARHRLQEASLDEVRTTAGWRLTEPLRRLAAARRS